MHVDYDISYNVEFDYNVIAADFLRAGINLPVRNKFCVMKNICELFNLPKYLKLAEAVNVCVPGFHGNMQALVMSEHHSTYDVVLMMLCS
jgi:hypothetical protein